MTQIDLGKMLPLYGEWTNFSSTVAKFSSDSRSDASHGLALLPRLSMTASLSAIFSSQTPNPLPHNDATRLSREHF
jgi:hypothetical protein